MKYRRRLCKGYIHIQGRRRQAGGGWHGTVSSETQAGSGELMGKQKRVHFRRELYEFVVVSATVKGQK